MGKINTFCTLFDRHYLDRGLALWDSLRRVCDTFTLYVFAFDRVTFRHLKEAEDTSLRVIAMEEAEDERLREVKKSRSRGEYCWTCTPVILEYVLEHFGEEICTYLDADLYFFRSPEALLTDFVRSGKSVMIIPHHYYRCLENRIDEKRKGKYCVQFNGFRNCAEGRRVLAWWKEKCLQRCSREADHGSFGDQKYVDDFEKISADVYVVRDLGAGVAPWNLAAYRLIRRGGGQKIWRDGKEWPLTFYHFHNLRWLDEQTVDIRVYVRPGVCQRELVERIYCPYLTRLAEIRRSLPKEIEREGAETETETTAAGHEQKPPVKPDREMLPVRILLKIRRTLRHQSRKRTACDRISIQGGNDDNASGADCGFCV